MPQRECGSHLKAGGRCCPVCFHPVCQATSPDGKLGCTRTAGHDGNHENGWNNPPITWLATAEAKEGRCEAT